MALSEHTGSGVKLVATRTKLLSHRASMGSLVDVRVDKGNELVAVPGTAGNPSNLLFNFEHPDTVGREEDDGHHPDYDTFDHVLQAASHHEAMYGYYYLDVNNKVSIVGQRSLNKAFFFCKRAVWRFVKRLNTYVSNINLSQVKVTEIFDVTEDCSPAIQTKQEREVNQQLEFDNDWETTQPGTASPDKSPRNNFTLSTMSQCVR